MAKRYSIVVIEGHTLEDVEGALASIVGPLLEQWLGSHLFGIRQAMGEEIPLELLRERCHIPGVRYARDYPAQRLIDVVARLESLLVGDQPPAEQP